MYNKPWHKKLIIVLAGVINNFILGFVILFVMALCYGSYTTKPIIGEVAKDSACEKAGMKTGDKIIKTGISLKQYKVSSFFLLNEKSLGPKPNENS